MRFYFIILFLPFSFLSQNFHKKFLVIDSLVVTVTQLPERLNFQQAQFVCQSLGNGWRLPTREEIYLIHEKIDLEIKHKIQTINDSIYYLDKGVYYWTAEEYGKEYAWIFNSKSATFFVTSRKEFLYVRFVRKL